MNDHKGEWQKQANQLLHSMKPVVKVAVTDHGTHSEWKDQTMTAAFSTAFTLAAADGPLPFGDIAAIVVLTGVGLYLFFED